MTERGRDSLSRTADTFQLGPSQARWDGRELVVSIDETAAPFPRRLRGEVRLTPRCLTGTEFDLDPAGRHRWRPVAPVADVTVSFEHPSWSWRGAGYLDSNDGDEPLGAAFRSWTWSRARSGEDAVVLYDTVHADGGQAGLAIRIAPNGTVHPMADSPVAPLPPTRIWRIPRSTRADTGARAQIIKTLEDAPFYARSLITTQLAGQSLQAVHESLSLTRLRQPAVKLMLPFRMPRQLW